MVSLHGFVVKIAGCERMDTQGSFKRINVFFTIVRGFGFPVISRWSIIRSDSDTSGNIFKMFRRKKGGDQSRKTTLILRYQEGN